MKPYAWVLTYQGVPARAIAQEADALAELARLNRQYGGDRDRRDLVPVFTEEQVQRRMRESLGMIVGGG